MDAISLGHFNDPPGLQAFLHRLHGCPIPAIVFHDYELDDIIAGTELAPICILSGGEPLVRKK